MKHLFLFLLLSFLGFSVSAQNLTEVVYLKNGSIIKGTIIEQIPNTSLKIQTADGSIFAYKMSEIQKITKEPALKYRKDNRSTPHKPQKIKLDGNGLQNGFRGFVDFGYTIGTGDWKVDRLELTGSFGYQFNPYLYTGLGVGVHYFHDSESVGIPIFAHIRSEFLKNSITPFAEMKIGYSVVDTDGFYCTPALGCRFMLNSGHGISASLGYSVQKSDVTWFDYYDTTSENFGGFTIKVGFDF